MSMKTKLLCMQLIWAATHLASAQTGSIAEFGSELTTVRATELRSDKLPTAAVLRQLATGVPLRMLSMEGGWALVQPKVNPGATTGWVRTTTLNLPADGVTAGGGNAAPALGVRSLPARANRHALIIGVGRYADPSIPPLPGVRIDRQSATQMARAMQVPDSNIRYLQDDQATGNSIRQALRDLTERVQDGDRVFIHSSGHGTRYNDPAAGGCVEALLAHDGGTSGTITNREMADLLKTITNKTDKLFVMYDACHSGGLAQTAAAARTRGLRNNNDEGLIRPKFSSITEECGRPVNIKTRNLLVEATTKGALPQDIIHVSAARDNEISFDDEQKGGLATQFMRDCMLREARDLDNSGAISMEEIRQCAQDKINKRMANDANFKPHNLVLNGNAAFVPAWFSQPSATPFVAAPTTAPTAPPPAPLTGEQALRQMFEQRDAKRQVRVAVTKDKLKVGQDVLDFAVLSDRPGYVYVALAGSDNKALYMLFPNELDKNNRIEAGQALLLPRPNWRVKAGGPAGTNNLLVMVADNPRDLGTLQGSLAGPFVTSLNDAQGRTRLGALMTSAPSGAAASCATTTARAADTSCSDAYGAAIFKVEEVQ